ncbi:MAG: PilZ domain-containing protein, partial [Bdellovibrionota bacterium]
MSELTRLRKSPRALLNHLVVLLDQSALLVDISEKGIRLAGLPADLALRPKEKVRIEWHPLASLEPEVLEATCRWVHNGEAGLSLAEPSKRLKFFIRALVHYH